MLTLDIKQTDTYRKWERKLRDSRAKALIAARIFRLANNLAGDVKPVGQGVSELRIHHGLGYRVYQRSSEIPHPIDSSGAGATSLTFGWGWIA